MKKSQSPAQETARQYAWTLFVIEGAVKNLQHCSCENGEFAAWDRVAQAIQYLQDAASLYRAVHKRMK